MTCSDGRCVVRIFGIFTCHWRTDAFGPSTSDKDDLLWAVGRNQFPSVGGQEAVRRRRFNNMPRRVQRSSIPSKHVSETIALTQSRQRGIERFGRTLLKQFRHCTFCGLIVPDILIFVATPEIPWPVERLDPVYFLLPDGSAINQILRTLIHLQRNAFVKPCRQLSDPCPIS